MVAFALRPVMRPKICHFAWKSGRFLRVGGRTVLSKVRPPDIKYDRVQADDIKDLADAMLAG